MKFLQIPTCSTNHLTFDSNSFLTSFHPLNECPVHIYVLQCLLRHDSSIHLGIIRLDSLALFSTISAGCRRQIGVPSATTIDAKSTSNNVKQVDEPFNLSGFTRPYYSHANEARHVRHTLGADRTRKMSGRWCDSHHKFMFPIFTFVHFAAFWIENASVAFFRRRLNLIPYAKNVHTNKEERKYSFPYIQNCPINCGRSWKLRAMAHNNATQQNGIAVRHAKNKRNW